MCCNIEQCNYVHMSFISWHNIICGFTKSSLSDLIAMSAIIIEFKFLCYIVNTCIQTAKIF